MMVTIIIIGVFFILGAMLGFFCGVSFGEFAIKKEALENNFGHYTCDPTNGETRFEWKEIEK